MFYYVNYRIENDSIWNKIYNGLSEFIYFLNFEQLVFKMTNYFGIYLMLIYMILYSILQTVILIIVDYISRIKYISIYIMNDYHKLKWVF